MTDGEILEWLLALNLEQVMAEAVSAQMQVAQAMLEVERGPLPVQVDPVPVTAKSAPKQSAHQLTMADLWQCHGVQITKRVRRKRKPVVVVQQLSLFGSQPAA